MPPRPRVVPSRGRSVPRPPRHHHHDGWVAAVRAAATASGAAAAPRQRRRCSGAAAALAAADGANGSTAAETLRLPTGPTTTVAGRGTPAEAKPRPVEEEPPPPPRPAAAAAAAAAAASQQRAPATERGESAPRRVARIVAEQQARLRADPCVALYHGGTVLSFVGFCMTDMLNLRLLSILGGISSLLFYYSRPAPVWDAVFWGVLFLAVNTMMMVRLVYDRVGDWTMTRDEITIFERFFRSSGITLQEYRQLLSLAERVDVAPGAPVRTHGEVPRDLMLVVDGRLRAFWPSLREQEGGIHNHDDEDPPQDHDIEWDGGWMGEMGFLARLRRDDGADHEPPTRPSLTSVTAVSQCRLLVWRDEVLIRHLRADVDLHLHFLHLLARVAQERMEGESLDTEYAALLRGVLIDGRVSHEQRGMVNRHRELRGIDGVGHRRHLLRMGWTQQEWDDGWKSSALIEDVQRRLDVHGLQHAGRSPTDAAGDRNGVGPAAPGLYRGAVRFSGYARAYGELATYFPASFRDADGLVWPTAEHYYQASKFDDWELRERIRAAPTALVAQQLGRRMWADHPDAHEAHEWGQRREAVQAEAARMKFSQVKMCRDVLLDTGDRPIVLDDASDDFWGSGADRRGANRLGEILMEVRDALRSGQLPTAQQCAASPPWALPGD